MDIDDIKKIPTLWDSWNRISYMFHRDVDDFPEIVFDQVNPDNIFQCLKVLLTSSRDVTTSFMLPESRQYVKAASPDAALSALASGQIVGAIGISLPVLPMITIYVDQPTRMSIAYMPGNHWTPISMAALFLLLHDVRWMLPESVITLIGDDFTVVDQYTFDQVFADYI